MGLRHGYFDFKFWMVPVSVVDCIVEVVLLVVGCLFCGCVRYVAWVLLMFLQV